MIGMCALEELYDKAQQWEKVRTFGQSLHFPSCDVAYDGSTETPADTVCRLLQELADRRKDPVPSYAYQPRSGCKCPNAYHEDYVDCPKPKATTYDERDMMAEHGAWFGKEHPGDEQKEGLTKFGTPALASGLFQQLRGQMVDLGLLSPDATDQTAFIAIRDILHAHAQDKSYDARYGAKTATNASKEQGRAL